MSDAEQKQSLVVEIIVTTRRGLSLAETACLELYENKILEIPFIDSYFANWMNGRFYVKWKKYKQI